MSITISSIGVSCIVLSLVLEFASYYKQIAKTLKTKKSAQVSSTAYLLKIMKYVVTLIGLALYSNWVGFGLEVGALFMCCIALGIVSKYKPKGWHLLS